MPDPKDIQVFVPCEGLCGKSLIIPFNLASEFFHANGTLKEKYRDVTFLCQSCAAWVKSSDTQIENAVQMLLAEPEAE